MIRKDNIKKTATLQEYIQVYEDSFEHSIDMSPYGIARETEQRMLVELKELILRNQKKQVGDLNE